MQAVCPRCGTLNRPGAHFCAKCGAALTPAPPARAAPAPISSPYVGLVPFTEEQAEYFFGRERETRLISAKLYASRLTLLYGPSGVGKSSILKAGVAHSLRKEDDVAVVVFNAWQGDPVAGLRGAIDGEVRRVQHARGEPPAPVAADTSLTAELKATAKYVGTIMVILDQFEEYFLYHSHKEGIDPFTVEISKAINRDDVPASFLISIREDAYTKLDLFKGRIPDLFANYVHLDHLDFVAAREAIEKPLAQYNFHRPPEQAVSIEPALVDAVLDQVKTGQVILGDTGRNLARSIQGSAPAEGRIETPYLQLVMEELWKTEMKSGVRTLRLSTLERLGGAEKIIRTHLDSVMRRLPRVQRDLSARVLRYLVTSSRTKIAHTPTDLANFAQVPVARVEPVLQRLSASDIRLLRPIAEATSQGETAYEIYHDALAPAIADWRSRYRRQQRTRYILWTAGGFSGLILTCAAITVVVTLVSGLGQSSRGAGLTVELLSGGLGGIIYGSCCAAALAPLLGVGFFLGSNWERTN